jgi:hypothetical protein
MTTQLKLINIHKTIIKNNNLKAKYSIGELKEKIA